MGTSFCNLLFILMEASVKSKWYVPYILIMTRKRFA